jgi:hypothetical protein
VREDSETRVLADGAGKANVGREQRLSRDLGRRNEDAIVDGEVVAKLPGASQQRLDVQLLDAQVQEARERRLRAAARRSSQR